MDMRFSLSRQRKVDPRVEDEKYRNARFEITHSSRPPMADAGKRRTTVVRGRRAADVTTKALRESHQRVESVRVKRGLFG